LKRASEIAADLLKRRTAKEIPSAAYCEALAAAKKRPEGSPPGQ